MERRLACRSPLSVGRDVPLCRQLCLYGVGTAGAHLVANTSAAHDMGEDSHDRGDEPDRLSNLLNFVPVVLLHISPPIFVCY